MTSFLLHVTSDAFFVKGNIYGENFPPSSSGTGSLLLGPKKYLVLVRLKYT